MTIVVVAMTAIPKECVCVLGGMCGVHCACACVREKQREA